MEILRDYRQISDKVQSIFGIDVTNIPILDPIPKSDIKKMVENCKVNNDATAVNGLAELIFQLNEYLPALCNFIKMFLETGYYAGIICFMEKLFVAHVGMSNYVSKNKEYSHEERFFDRFIEVAKSCDLQISDLLPFMFAIIQDNEKTILSVWLDPALEYMQNVYRENMEEVNEFVASEPKYLELYYELGLEFNTQKTIAELFDTNDNVLEDKLIAKILKHYYVDVMAFFDKNLDNSGNKKLHYVKLLASIENPEATARLQNLYEEDQNEEIKAYIKAKLGIADKQNLGVSPKHFQIMAQKKVDCPQERTLGVPFEKMPLKFCDDTVADNLTKTYLINLFKSEKDLLNLYGLNDVKTLFNVEDLSSFAESILYALKKLKDIKEAKWAIRFVSLCIGDEYIEKVFDFIEDLYRQNRKKEAKYFVECLIYSKKEKVLQLIYKLSSDYEQEFGTHKEEFIKLYSEVLDKNNTDVMDMLVNDELSEEVLNTQKNRLYSSFIANKSYTKEQFNSMFIDKKVFNTLAQNLVFGEFKFDRLFALFVLKDKQINYIAGTAQTEDKDLRIKIAHGLDLDDRFEEAKNYYNNPTFEQFENRLFEIKESEKTLTKVGSMHGVLINANRFIQNMLNFGFIANVNEDSEQILELVNVCEELNILAEVSFESPITNNSSSSSIGFVRFYKLNQCLKNKKAYIINKANAIAIGGVEPRYYDFVLNCVSKSIRI